MNEMKLIGGKKICCAIINETYFKWISFDGNVIECDIDEMRFSSLWNKSYVIKTACAGCYLKDKEDLLNKTRSLLKIIKLDNIWP